MVHLGSIVGIERRALVVGLAKIAVPLAIGSALAICIGTLVGTALELKPPVTLFLLVVPIMGGGVTTRLLARTRAPDGNRSYSADFAGDPGRARTCDPLLRR